MTLSMDSHTSQLNNKNIAEEGNEEEFRQTGPETVKNKSKYYFSTQDLLITAILGVMGGIISGLVPFSALIKAWYPFVGGTQMISGHHILWLVLAYGLTKKKPSILLTAVIKGFMNFFLGSSWSIFEVVINLYEGTSLIIGFYIMEKFNEGNTRLGWGIAGGIGNITQVPLFWIITGKLYLFHYTLLIMAMMLAFVSGLIMAGLLGKIIIERLKKANVS